MALSFQQTNLWNRGKSNSRVKFFTEFEKGNGSVSVRTSRLADTLTVKLAQAACAAVYNERSAVCDEESSGSEAVAVCNH